MKGTLTHKTAVIATLLALAGGTALLLAQQETRGEPPLAFPCDDVTLRIVGATFVSKLEGTDARFETADSSLYRGLVLTVEMKKPAGREITLVAQDCALHYHYGTHSDVARCYGLSTFSSAMETDRAMKLWSAGLGRSVTGLSSTQAETVFVDMFFQSMEADSSELHLFVAQPVGASFTTAGWTR